MANEAFNAPLKDCMSAEWYHDHNDHRCPHDSWVESVALSEPSSGERHEQRGVAISVRLLGAYHDGFVELSYRGVHAYSVTARAASGHGDWLRDELQVATNNLLLHKVTLTNGDWVIKAEEIQYRWIPLSAV